MKQKIVCILIVGIFLLTALGLSASGIKTGQTNTLGNVINVYPGDSISYKIREASNGDIVHVHKGAYREDTIIIDKAITLEGEFKIGGSHNTMIIGEENADFIISIWSDNVTVKGFTIVGEEGTIGFKSSYYGVDNCRIEGNYISNIHKGIEFTHSNYNNIVNNFFGYNDYGLRFIFSNNNNFWGNMFSFNKRGARIITGDNNIFTDNNYCRDANKFYNNELYGIRICGDYNEIIGTTFKENQNGLEFEGGSSGNKIYNNNFDSNFGYSIYLFRGTDNTIIYHNNFENKGLEHALSEGVYKDFLNNNWDNGQPYGGNYWDDYNRVGFNPYNIPGDNEEQDNHPLSKPYLQSKAKSTNTVFKTILGKLITTFPNTFSLLKQFLKQ